MEDVYSVAPTLKGAPAHNRISPTAKLVAYWRKFSDIPYAVEAAEWVQAEGVVQGMLQSSDLEIQSFDWMAALLEARYKSLVYAIRREGIRQVLELASGVSLRGLAMTEDPETLYVETDLPEITEEKIGLVKKLISEEGLRQKKNLFFHAVNALSLPEIEVAARRFTPNRPVAVVHEGLLGYLNADERDAVAKNIHSVLSRFGGVWITPDFITKRDYTEGIYRHLHTQRLTDAIKGATQRNLYESAFEDEEAVGRFLQKQGFLFKVAPQIDGSFPLVSAERLGLSADWIDQCKAELRLWTIRLA